MAKSAARRMTEINRKRAETLLFPVIASLYAVGLVKEEIQFVVSALYEKQHDSRKIRRLEHVGHPTHDYGDVVALWTRDKRFIDYTGRPRILPFSGANSFSTLVRQINPKMDPKFVQLIFKRYNTIRSVNHNACELLTPYFCISTNDDLAFEPSTYFLLDAGVTLGRIMRRSNTKVGKPQAFWRKVERQNVSRTTARKFNLFARERSQALLEELDEWLEVHGRPNQKKPLSETRRRVGIGLFSISSDSEG